MVTNPKHKAYKKRSHGPWVPEKPQFEECEETNPNWLATLRVGRMQGSACKLGRHWLRANQQASLM